MKLFRLTTTLVTLSILAGCQAQQVGGDTGETSVFDETITVEQTTPAPKESLKSLERIAQSGGFVYVEVSDDKGTTAYQLPYEEGVKLMLSKDNIIEAFPLVKDSMGDTENTSGVFKTSMDESYLYGAYYAKKVNETKSTILFTEMDQSHIDLLEVTHEEGQYISYVHMDQDLRNIYYELSNKDNSLAGSYYHHLPTNTSVDLNDDQVLAGYWAGREEIHLFQREIINGLIVESGLYAQIEDQSGYDMAEKTYDVVIANGIVMDPDTNTIKVGYDIGVVGDEIVVITDADLTGTDIIDAKGLVVAPGFIDMLGFNLTTTVSKYKITDGVTTNLSLHGCSSDFDSFFNTYENNAPQYVNFGGAVFMIHLRSEAGLGWYSGTPTQEQIDFMVERTREEIEAGAVAIAFSPEYYPATTGEEIKAVMALAAEYDIPTHFHLRYSAVTGDELGIYGVEEVIGYAKETGARVEIMHLHSTGGTAMMDEALQLINDAREEGVKITFDIYPYDSWASKLSMARFRGNWQERYAISYDDLVIAGNGVQVTEENFDYYKGQQALAIAYAMDEEEMLAALSQPYAQVGSDGNIESETQANNHFRGAGTFSRILGKYVRDEDVFSLMEGLRKMTISGAKWLEPISEDMARRGRLQEGAIADITVFDYKTVLDQSTPEKPATESIGIDYVLVSGQIGLREGKLQTSVKAGVAIKSNYLEE